MTVAVGTGVWIGALDLLRRGGLVRHTVLDSASRTEYPPDPGGVWAFAVCGDPAYHYADSTAVAKRLPACPGCTSPTDNEDAPRA